MQHANQQGTTRRTMLRAGAAAGTAAALGAAGLFAAGTASAATARRAAGRRRGASLPVRCHRHLALHPRGRRDLPRLLHRQKRARRRRVHVLLLHGEHHLHGRLPGRRLPSWQAVSGFFTPYLPSRAGRRDLLPAAHRRRHAKRRGRARGHHRFLRLRDTRPVLRHLRQQPQDHPLGRLLGRPQLPPSRTPSPAPTPPTSGTPSRTRTPPPSRPRRRSRPRSRRATPPRPSP